MSDEIENVKKRLKVIEAAIKELTETDLYLAKQIFGITAPTEMNIASRTMTGAEGKQFRKLFDEKLDIAKAKLTKAKTPAEAFQILIEFDNEVSDYVTATKVDTADKAMDIAHSFIKKYVPVALPLKAERKNDEWLVDIDVGALAVKVAKVKVDAKTGDVLSYDIPTKASKKTK
jgi:hypothetical protein